jgi:hypothetical protein
MSQNSDTRHGSKINRGNIGPLVVWLGQTIREHKGIAEDDPEALCRFNKQYRIADKATIAEGIDVLTKRTEICMRRVHVQAYEEGGVALEALAGHLMTSFRNKMVRLGIESESNTDSGGTGPNEPLFKNPIEDFTKIAEAVRGDDVYTSSNNILSFLERLEDLLKQAPKYDESITTENDPQLCPKADWINRVLVVGVGLLSTIAALVEAKSNVAKGAAS